MAKNKSRSKDKARQNRKKQEQKRERAKQILERKQQLKLEESKKPIQVPSDDTFSASDYSQDYEISRAFEDETLYEDDVILDNLNKLLDKLNNFDPSLVQSYKPEARADKMWQVHELKQMVNAAIEYWDEKNLNGKNMVAKGIDHYASEVFEAVQRIMYLCYVSSGGNTVPYNPSADIELLEKALYYNENYYEEQLEIPTEDFEDIPF